MINYYEGQVMSILAMNNTSEGYFNHLSSDADIYIIGFCLLVILSVKIMEKVKESR